jgi:hypothetical protein
MVNEKSLENLRKPKVRKEGHGYQYSLPQEKIDALFTNLAEGMGLKKAAKACDICFPTASKYFRDGDVKRGIKPLQWRLTVFQDKISEKYNILLEERRIEMLTSVRTTLKTINANIESKDCPACAGTKIQEGKDGLKLLCPACKGEGKIVSNLMSKSTLKDMERLMRLEVFLLGGVSQKEVEHKMLTAEGCSGDNQEG